MRGKTELDRVFDPEDVYLGKLHHILSRLTVSALPSTICLVLSANGFDVIVLGTK